VRCRVRLFSQLELRDANIHDESLGRRAVAASPGLDTEAAWQKCLSHTAATPTTTLSTSPHRAATPDLRHCDTLTMVRRKSGQGQRASARCHQLSVATTASAATESGSSSWIVETWLAAAAPPMPIHSAGAA
jgi:hypothetical protein